MSVALQLARSRTRLALSRRCLATAAAHPGSSAPMPSSSADASEAVIPLSNVEAQWEKLGAEEQRIVHRKLEEIQKKDWKALSIDEKKAAYYVAFGPHGPRTPTTPAGQPLKIFLATVAVMGLSLAIFGAIRANAPPAPQTMTKEWQEAMNERAKEQKMNPISGIASEGYEGKGFVQSK